MEKKLFDIKVYTSDENYICIEQEDFGHDNAVILLHPDQIELLFKWLKEAQQEIIKEL